MSTVQLQDGIVEHWCHASECCDPMWEAAYQAFESPEAERRKFASRFRHLGVAAWPRDWHTAELFCGRGNGMAALEQMGFSRLYGVDLSASLLKCYHGPATLFVGDCRDLRFDDRSLNAIVIQGGLHHLPSLPDDLERTLAEIHRVLCPGGKLLLVEPWLTPFLRLVHALSRQTIARHLSPRLNALQVMIEREAETYFRWLSMPEEILAMVTARFEVERCHRRFGKLMFVGRKSG